MDFNDTPQEAAFRAEARAWLAANAPAHVIPEGERLDDAEEVARGKVWQRTVYDGGYAGITLPKALGGRGGTIVEAVVFAEEESRYPLPKGPYIANGFSLALPVIGKHGSPEQIARFTDATLKGDLIWCQLFSEPSGGSDLAGLRTRAVRDGSDWIVNGQKVWSSWAHRSDWGILVVRTDGSVPKHKGLTFFVVDMKTPGIDVRPIRQISGASEFNATFLTDVRIPDANRIGAVGEGWSCCMTVLMGERLDQGGGEKGGVRALIAYAGQTPADGGTALDKGSVRVALAQGLAEEQAAKYFQARLRTMVSRGENPGAMAAMVKLAYGARLQKTSGLALELRGPDALAPHPDDRETRRIHQDYILASAMRIGGGADEVLRDQISERILGMPRDSRPDKDLPFDQLR
jgi:alkylation response protein AidB-like acyl-CoA dehydrogenase